MDGHGTVRREPIHLMLLPFPIALWTFSLASDGIYHFGFGGPVWSDIALYTMVAGVGGALAAAIPAYFDYRALALESATWRPAQRLLLLNVVIVVLYGLNVWIRLDADPRTVVPAVVSMCGAILLAWSGWLGGALASVHEQTVERARSSRDGTPADEQRAA